MRAPAVRLAVRMALVGAVALGACGRSGIGTPSGTAGTGGSGGNGTGGSGGNGTGGTTSPTGGTDELGALTEVTLQGGPPMACKGQRAFIPASGTVERTYQPTPDEALRNTTADYVAYAVRVGELFIYFSFAPTLPAHPTTADVRSSLSYAYVDFRLKQPPDAGGSLELLSSNIILHLAAFDRLEVQNGKLAFHLATSNGGAYTKELRTGDGTDSTPAALAADCVTGDILGMCYCSFKGGVVTISLAGDVPL
jgi:hypothetical protein